MHDENHVGDKIKRLRQEMQITAKDLAKSADISSSMLSLLEKGSTQGSVETLRKIAKVLNTTIASLFSDESSAQYNKSDESFLIVRKNSRKKISFSDPLYKCELLVPDLQGEVEVLLVELAPHRITDEILPHTRGGEECNMVINGVIEVQVGDTSYTLYEGDTIRFNPSTPHKIENRSDKKASYVSIITPPSF